MNSNFSQVLSLIVPPLCLACQTVIPLGEQENLCVECRKKILPWEKSICRCCGDALNNPEIENSLCGDCLQDPSAFEWARSVFQLSPELSKIVHSFKYAGEESALPWMTSQMQDYLEKNFPGIKFDYIIPVPLHWWRLLRRGYNQSLLLAKALAKKRNEKLDFDSLVKTKASKAQSSLSKTERLKQLKMAFRLKSPEKFKDKTILLVDDVYTTGSTLQECAKVLKQADAEVFAFTLARTVLKF